MLRSTRVRLAAVATAATLSLGVAAGPAAAAPPQTGLVNVNVENNTVQVPIAVAANVCGAQVGVLAAALAQGPVNCTATPDATATRAPGTGGAGGGPQTGLVNLNITDNVIQVPVGIAANICGVQAGVLAVALLQSPVTCEATGNSTANAPA
jgi:hypothetical protein